jgi:hypothetical protein
LHLLPMKSRSLLFFLFLALAARVVGAVATAPAAPATASDEAAKRWAQYEPSFKTFAELDAARAFPAGGILFVGSSIFRQWTNVPEQMAPLPVLNRAFGGSRASISSCRAMRRASSCITAAATTSRRRRPMLPR